MGVKAFFIDPTMTRRLYLRRYVWRDGSACSVRGSMGCEAIVPFADEAFAWRVDSRGDRTFPDTPEVSHDDARWPTVCRHCHQPLPAEAEWQVFQDQIYRRVDTGEMVPHRDAHPGALWYLEGWADRYYRRIFPAGGPDGKFLSARTPGGDWVIDSRASNCTMKDDNTHRCWIRHGDPLTGQVTVDKNGLTCAAGGGSIDTGRWHGFLRNGEFVA